MTLHNTPIKVITTIAEFVIDDVIFAKNNDSINFDKALKLLENRASWAGKEFDYNDVEFMKVFISENYDNIISLKNDEVKFKDIVSSLKIPKVKKFMVNVRAGGKAYYTTELEKEFNGFDIDLTRNRIQTEIEHTGLETYVDNFKEVEYSIEDWDPSWFDVDYIKEIMTESKSKKISKVIIENSEKILENLDRKTLINLRKLIDLKLSSF